MFAARISPLGRVVISFLFILLQPSYESFAATRYDPHWQWYTLAGEHFDIHYHDGEEAWAGLAMAAAERAHQKLTVELNWRPAGKTDIVLADRLDWSNGGTMVYPEKHIELYMVLPTALDLIDRGDYFEKLVAHEYAHVLHLDMARGGVRAARNFFGRHFLLFPNQFQPFWGIEGIATYFETDAALGIGRGQSSFYAMLMRTEVSNGLKPLSQVNQVIDTWPGGTVRYLYGVEFFKFIEQRYGKEKIEEMSREYSDNIFPFFVNQNFKKVFKSRLTKIWPEFEQWLKERYNAQSQSIRSAGLVEGQALTQFGGDTGNPRVLGDGTLYFIREDNASAPALMTRQGDETKLITTLHPASMFDVHPSAGFIIAQPEWCDNVKLFYDLYTIPLQGGESTRLTKCERLRDPAWRPDGEAIAAVQVSGLVNRLVILDKKGRTTKVLWNGETGELIHRPTWSPDGKKIAATLWRKDQGVQIWEYLLDENKWVQATQGDALHFYPTYNKLGELIYSADEDGVFNLYLHKKDGSEIHRVTRTITGAFMPVAGGDGNYYYQGYGAKGYDIYRIQPSPEMPVVAMRLANYAPLEPLTRVDTGTPVAYSPWKSLRPRWWLPVLYSDLLSNNELLVLTSGRDALGRHTYSAGAGYNFGFKKAEATLLYSYDRYDPVLSLAGSSTNYLNYVDKEHWELRHLDYVQPNIAWNWRQFSRSWYLSLDETVTDDVSVRQLNVFTDVPSRKEVFSTLTVSMNTFRFDSNLGHSPNSGYRVSLDIVDEQIKEGSNTAKAQSARLSYNHFIPVGDGQQISFTLGWGYRHADETGDVSSFPIFSGLATRSSLQRTQVERHWLNDDIRATRMGETSIILGSGDQIYRGTLEWRSPMGFVERGIMAPPIAIQKYYASAFLTGGHWQVTSEDILTHQAVRDEYYVAKLGVDINTKMSLFYGYFPLWFTFGGEYDIRDHTTKGILRLETEAPF